MAFFQKIFKWFFSRLSFERFYSNDVPSHLPEFLLAEGEHCNHLLQPAIKDLSGPPPCQTSLQQSVIQRCTWLSGVRGPPLPPCPDASVHLSTRCILLLFDPDQCWSDRWWSRWRWWPPPRLSLAGGLEPVQWQDPNEEREQIIRRLTHPFSPSTPAEMRIECKRFVENGDTLIPYVPLTSINFNVTSWTVHLGGWVCSDKLLELRWVAMSCIELHLLC